MRENKDLLCLPIGLLTGVIIGAMTNQITIGVISGTSLGLVLSSVLDMRMHNHH